MVITMWRANTQFLRVKCVYWPVLGQEYFWGHTGGGARGELFNPLPSPLDNPVHMFFPLEPLGFFMNISIWDAKMLTRRCCANTYIFSAEPKFKISAPRVSSLQNAHAFAMPTWGWKQLLCWRCTVLESYHLWAWKFDRQALTYMYII